MIRTRLIGAAIPVSAAVLGACQVPAPTTESQLDALRKDTALVIGLESSVPLISYESVLDEWARVRKAHEQALASGPDVTQIKDRLSLIDRRIERLSIERSYAPKIELRNLQRSSGTRTNFGLAAEGIFGEIKNTGGLTVIHLKLQFELVDANGKAVGEAEYSPVFDGSREGPLKPNYTLPFGVAVDRPPSDWVSVRGVVDNLRLSREGLRFAEEEQQER